MLTNSPNEIAEVVKGLRRSQEEEMSASTENGFQSTVKTLYNDHLSYCDTWSLKTHDFSILLIFRTGST